MEAKLAQQLAALGKKAEGAMPPGMMPPQMAAPGMADPMAGGGGMPMGPQPVPTAEEIMAMSQDPAMMGGAPAGGIPAAAPGMDPAMMGIDPAMMGIDPAAMGAPVEPPIQAGPSEEELAVDLANAKALSSMGQAVQGLTDVMAKQQASTAATMMNAADSIVASPVGEELTPEDIGPLMEGDAV